MGKYETNQTAPPWRQWLIYLLPLAYFLIEAFAYLYQIGRASCRERV